uniref:Uncharacterized protein n=1 Tax=Vespula pensylvanica TaxID=30213 RepID=A0A834PCI5_VESPE|nr:hypothetical protein H0235_003771 [Vespula pensylvanica]
MERWKGTEGSGFRDDFRDDFREASHHSTQSSHSPPNFQRFLSQTLPPHSVPNSVSHSVPSGIVHWLLQGSRNEGTTITTPPPPPSPPPASGTTVVEPFQSELLLRLIYLPFYPPILCLLSPWFPKCKDGEGATGSRGLEGVSRFFRFHEEVIMKNEETVENNHF